MTNEEVLIKIAQLEAELRALKLQFENLQWEELSSDEDESIYQLSTRGEL
jgi:hypothetical protein